jgi:hypothetical protein
MSHELWVLFARAQAAHAALIHLVCIGIALHFPATYHLFLANAEACMQLIKCDQGSSTLTN